MFDNPGKKIMQISKIVFWIVTIVSVILAFVLGFEKHYYSTEFYAEIFFPLFFGVPTSAYVSTLFLVGFGELVENSKKTEAAKVLEEAEEKAKEAEEKAKEAEEKAKEAARIANASNNTNSIVCTKCGCEIAGSRNECPNCGGIGTMVEKQVNHENIVDTDPENSNESKSEINTAE